jgi:hypothetical protein
VAGAQEPGGGQPKLGVVAPGERQQLIGLVDILRSPALCAAFW